MPLRTAIIRLAGAVAFVAGLLGAGFASAYLLTEPLPAAPGFMASSALALAGLILLGTLHDERDELWRQSRRSFLAVFALLIGTSLARAAFEQFVPPGDRAAIAGAAFAFGWVAVLAALRGRIVSGLREIWAEKS